MMDIETALQGMMDSKAKLQTPDGVSSLPVMSENMQRLAAYTSAVEDILASYEYELEIKERDAYYEEIKGGKKPTPAEREAKYAVAEEKGQIKRLVRLVNSSWKLIDTVRSRYNHLNSETRGQV